MKDGVVIFSQKDVDDGVVEIMEAFASDMGLSTPEMLKQIFVRRMATEISHHKARGSYTMELYQDKKIANISAEHPNGSFVGLLDAMVENMLENEYGNQTVGGLQ